MLRVKFSNHCLVLFGASFAAELWLHRLPLQKMKHEAPLTLPPHYAHLSSTCPSSRHPPIHLSANPAGEHMDGFAGTGTGLLLDYSPSTVPWSSRDIHVTVLSSCRLPHSQCKQTSAKSYSGRSSSAASDKTFVPPSLFNF